MQANQFLSKLHIPLNRELVWSLAAIAGAAVTYGLCSLLFPEQRELLAQQVFQPLVDTFLGVITTLAMVMIFTSTVSGICGIGDIKTFTSYGKAILLHFQKAHLYGVLLSVAFILALGKAELGGASADFTLLLPLLQVLLDIVPVNIFRAFTEQNAMQIIIIGLVTGWLFLQLPENTRRLQALVKEIDCAVIRLLELVCSAIPFLVYCSISQLLLSGSLGKAALVMDALWLYLAVSVTFLTLRTLYIAHRTKIGFGRLLKDFAPVCLLGFATVSSINQMLMVEEICEKKYRTEKVFRDFALPLELISLAPTCAIYLTIFPLLFLETYGIKISLLQLVSAVLMITIITPAIPPVPGGTLIILAIVFEYFGLPKEAMTLPIAADVVFDMLNVAMIGLSYGTEFLLMDRCINRRGEI